jgi:hypothetical protein
LEVNAETATGTVCRFTARLSAVTMTVSISAKAGTVKAAVKKIVPKSVRDRTVRAERIAGILSSPFRP